MGMTGRWIDSLTDADRDAIIEHPDPAYEGRKWWDAADNCGCLVGCVVRRWETPYAATPLSLLCCKVISLVEYRAWNSVGFRFPELTARFGAPRVWRAVKLRAARASGTLVHVDELGRAERVREEAGADAD